LNLLGGTLYDKIHYIGCGIKIFFHILFQKCVMIFHEWWFLFWYSVPENFLFVASFIFFSRSVY